MASLPFLGMEHVEPSAKNPTKTEWLKQFDTISFEDSQKVMAMPQHNEDGSANEGWLKWRVGRMTGSKSAKVVQLHYHDMKPIPKPHTHKVLKQMLDAPIDRPSRLCNELLNDKFTGNAATAHGNAYEDACEETFLRSEWYYYHEYYLKFGTDKELVDSTIDHPGLCISPTDSWCGMSPDGIIRETWKDGSVTKNLCEWKCPYYKRNNQVPVNLYGPIETSTGQEYNITAYYYCQVQMGMGLLYNMGLLLPENDDPKNLYCYFGVWIFSGIECSKIPFDPMFYVNMMTKAKSFWNTHYLPALFNHLYPAAHTWTGRSIEDMGPMLTATKAYIDKKLGKHGHVEQVVDWGAGGGLALMQFARHFPLATTLTGYELNMKSYFPIPLPETISIQYDVDIMDVEIPKSHAVARMHYIYDGGVYPFLLSERIAFLISQSRDKHCFVLVVTSLAPPNAPGNEFTVKDWKNYLGFTKTKCSMEVYENTTQDEPTMKATLFYKCTK
jgi:hypothetical protein